MILRTLSLLLAAASGIACATPGGVPDPGFGDHGFAFLSLDGVEGHELRAGAALALPDGSLLYGGSRNLRVAGNPDPHVRAMLARMHADGSPDETFNTDPALPGIRVMDDLVPGTASQQIEAIARLADGTILATGTATAFGPLTCFVIRLDAGGNRDATFADGAGLATIPRAHCHALVVDADGGIVVAGERIHGTTPNEGFLARFDADGTPDAAFGNGGIASLPAVVEDESGYLGTLAIGPRGVLVVGGSYEAFGAGMGADFSLARFTADGQLDTTFAGSGWRVFHADGDASTFNGIDRLLVDGGGAIVFGGHRQDAQGSVQVVLGAVAVDGSTDTTFGNAGSGFAPIDFAPDAAARYVTGLVRQSGGALVASATEAVPGRSDFVAFRTDAHGVLDPQFGSAGIASIDLAPTGTYSNATALVLQGDVPVVAGPVKRDPSSLLVDLGAVRLVDVLDDTIFTDDFDVVHPLIVDFDDLTEGFEGNAFDYAGIHFHDCNGLDVTFPDGSTSTAELVGDQYIIENATLFYPDFPGIGSSPNMLTFGGGYINGDNFSIGALSRAILDLPTRMSAARFDMAYYENGPWGGIVLHVEALLGGEIVATRTLTIANGGGRDNIATTSMLIEAAAFDTLHLYATFGDQPSAPRVMIDNLTLTPAPPPAP
ncbi:putative delta-60 repeat protein [Dokdonella fugitiva]|uniref:Putative delta-60 repeat protein n=1 Tax=Dokdonella fugitiva TaxID=328517 RepID=A0A839F5E5_9GAMM|nr:hypothetical protein [Dokdonella fugitiva]MBA8889282.1 putative delta-60 repeat protein [Dokdonella fugitiva]